MFPKLISIGHFFIPTYGTLVAIGFLMGLWVTVRLAGLAGAKLFMVLFDFKEYWDGSRRLFSLETLQAAGVYQGGFLLALLTAALYIRQNHLPGLHTCDVFAP